MPAETVQLPYNFHIHLFLCIPEFRMQMEMIFMEGKQPSAGISPGRRFFCCSVIFRSFCEQFPYPQEQNLSLAGRRRIHHKRFPAQTGIGLTKHFSHSYMIQNTLSAPRTELLRCAPDRRPDNHIISIIKGELHYDQKDHRDQ